MIRLYIILLSVTLFSCTKEEGKKIELVPGPDVSVYKPNEMYAGYTLVAPFNQTKAYLIDAEGFVVKKWDVTNLPGAETALLPDGRLLRAEKMPNAGFSAGGAGGRIHLYNWDNSISWEYDINNTHELQHHDIKQLPNGNFLVTVWEKQPLNEIIQKGKDVTGTGLTEMWFDKIQEIKPTGSNTGEVVWEWKLWDHLIQDFDSRKSNFGDVARNPNKVDINYKFLQQGGAANFTHINGLEYIPDYDIIVMSVRNFSELWFIDHSTTKAEAATGLGGRRGKGGDLLYRWGNDYAYKSAAASDRKLFAQHNPTFIGNLPGHGGNIMVFNNAQTFPDLEGFSTISEIRIPFNGGNMILNPAVSNAPGDYAWNFLPHAHFYSKNVSSAQRLPNGNTLIAEGEQRHFYEVNAAGEWVWKYTNPLSLASHFKAIRYATDYPAFNGKKLIRTGEKIE